MSTAPAHAGLRASASRAALAAERIAGMIMNGELQDGDRLTEEDLAGPLGMSRLPVREALRTLEQEGLVTVLPRRGAFVKRYGPREITEVYDVRAELLGFAARLVAQTIDAERLDNLERILDGMREAVPRDDYAAYVEGQQRLRRTAWEATPNSLLREMIWRVWRRGLRLRAVALRLPGRMAHSLHVHEQFARALRERDGYYAERLMWLLCVDAKQALLDQYFGAGAERGGRLERDLPDLSGFQLPRTPTEFHRQGA